MNDNTKETLKLIFWIVVFICCIILKGIIHKDRNESEEELEIKQKELYDSLMREDSIYKEKYDIWK